MNQSGRSSPSMATKEDDKLIKLFIEIYRFRNQNPEFNELSFYKMLQDKDKHYKFYLFNIKPDSMSGKSAPPQ
jgi:hypothetical protein